MRNWAEYNKGLQNRGSITFWLNDDAIANWYETEKTGKRGSSPKNLSEKYFLAYKAMKLSKYREKYDDSKAEISTFQDFEVIFGVFNERILSFQTASKYSDVAIETMITMQSIYGLAGRQCVAGQTHQNQLT